MDIKKHKKGTRSMNQVDHVLCEVCESFHKSNLMKAYLNLVRSSGCEKKPYGEVSQAT
jgi:hypothetical protein